MLKFQRIPSLFTLIQMITVSSSLSYANSTNPVPSTCSSIGSQKVAVIVATYPGSNYPPVSIEYLRELFLGTSESPSPSVKDFYTLASGRRVSLEHVDFFGPYSFAQPYAVDTSKVKMIGEGTFDYDRAIFDLAKQDVHLENYDRLVLVSPEALDAKTGQRIDMAAGLSSTDCSQVFNDGRISKRMGVSWILGSENYSGDQPNRIASPSIWNSWSSAQKTAGLEQLKTEDMKALIHELGHTFGLGHANTIISTEVLPAESTPINCDFYGDYYDVMADSVTSPLNIPHRSMMGWLSDGELQTITQPGTFRIFPSDSIHPGLRGLKIPRLKTIGDTTEAALWVEYRNGASLYEKNSNVGSSISYNGALVHYTNPKQAYTSNKFHWVNETLVLNFNPGMLGTGANGANEILRGAWQDAHSLIGLEVLDVTPDYMDVKVTF